PCRVLVKIVRVGQMLRGDEHRASLSQGEPSGVRSDTNYQSALPSGQGVNPTYALTARCCLTMPGSRRPLLTGVATCRQQRRNVLDYLTACCRADHHSETFSSLLLSCRAVTDALAAHSRRHLATHSRGDELPELIPADEQAAARAGAADPSRSYPALLDPAAD